MRFLIVDDSRAMQSIIKRALQNLNLKECDIKTADNGELALDIIRQWKPDLLLTDWHMPTMDGMELMAKVQREMLDIKTGFITTETSEKRIAAAKEAGALFVIQKPFEQKDIEQYILPVIQRHDKPDMTEKALIGQSDKRHFVLPNANRLAKIINALSRDEVLVEAVEPVNIHSKQLPCLVGLFDDGHSTSIRAVCVLELRAACILGAAIAGLPAASAREAISNKTIEGPVLKGCSDLLKILSAAIYDVNNQTDLQLRSANVVPAIFPKLESIYTFSSNARCDCEVAVLDMGQGLMTIITV